MGFADLARELNRAASTAAPNMAPPLDPVIERRVAVAIACELATAHGDLQERVLQWYGVCSVCAIQMLDSPSRVSSSLVLPSIPLLATFSSSAWADDFVSRLARGALEGIDPTPPDIAARTKRASTGGYSAAGTEAPRVNIRQVCNANYILLLGSIYV